MGRRWGSKSNCFGYALNKRFWGLFTERNDDGDGSFDEERLEFTEPGVANEYLLQRFPFLRPVSKSQMVLGKEYIVFRYGSFDFHFMKRNKTGHWRHKQGLTPVAAIAQKKVFADEWVNPDGDTYDSEFYIYEVAQ